MATPLEQIVADIATTRQDLAEAKAADDQDAIASLRAILLEQLREKNMLLAREFSSSSSSAVRGEPSTSADLVELDVAANTSRFSAAASSHDWVSSSSTVNPMLAVLEKVEEVTRVLGFLVPIVCDIQIDANNLWASTQSNDSASTRSRSFRTNLLKHLGYPATATQFYCMVSGVQGDSSQIEAAHIVPVSSKVKYLYSIGLQESDVNSMRNGLLLASGIHKAFDSLQLSFVRSPNPLQDCLVLKVWDESCLNNPVCEGSTLCIRDCVGNVLVLNGHKPFMRALSYQAYIAFVKHKHAHPSGEPIEYGSENESRYFSSRREMRNAVIKAMREEIDDDEEI